VAKKARYQRQHDKCDAMRNFHFHSAVKERKKSARTMTARRWNTNKDIYIKGADEGQDREE